MYIDIYIYIYQSDLPSCGYLCSGSMVQPPHGRSPPVAPCTVTGQNGWPKVSNVW